MVGQRGTVVEDSDVEIELGCERGDGLGDVTGTGDPESAGRCDGFAVKEIGCGVCFRNGEIFFDAPGESGLAVSEFLPEGIAGGLSIGDDEAGDFAAADEAIVPTEIVIEQEVEGGGLIGLEGLNGAVLDFSFETAAAQSAFDTAIGIEESLGTDLLRAGTFRAGDEGESDGFAGTGGFSQSLENEVLHGAVSACLCGQTLYQ